MKTDTDPFAPGRRTSTTASTAYSSDAPPRPGVTRSWQNPPAAAGTTIAPSFTTSSRNSGLFSGLSHGRKSGLAARPPASTATAIGTRSPAVQTSEGNTTVTLSTSARTTRRSPPLLRS